MQHSANKASYNQPNTQFGTILHIKLVLAENKVKHKEHIVNLKLLPHVWNASRKLLKKEIKKMSIGEKNIYFIC